MTDVDNEMIEIFTEECTALLEELGEAKENAVRDGEYSLEAIQDIFRSIHTLKADATMMFYENIAEISRSFESVLYFLRDEEKEVKDQARFHYLLERFLEYVQTELHKIEAGQEADGSNKELMGLITSYPQDDNQKKTSLKERFSDALYIHTQDFPVAEELAQKIRTFYIPGASDTDYIPEEEGKTGQEAVKASDYIERLRGSDTLTGQNGKKQNQEEAQEEICPRKIEKYNRRKHTIVTEEDIEFLQEELQLFRELVSSYEDRLKEVSVIGMTIDDLGEYKKHEKRLEHWIRQVTTTDFTQVAEKMQGVAREMTQKLGKKVEIVIVGEKTLIEKSKKEKIAGAMIHILRNAIDHGIEKAEERQQLGKNVVGTVLINITKKKGDHVRVDISDDGKGLDTGKILKKAEEKGFLYKPAEEFSEKEIFELTMIPGFSTTTEISDYSGRGVGMDVVRHNIEGIGGTLKLHSKFGKGTKVSIFL